MKFKNHNIYFISYVHFVHIYTCIYKHYSLCIICSTDFDWLSTRLIFVHLIPLMYKILPVFENMLI